MLHPGLGSIELWQDFPQKLSAATGCSILLYSRYGYGRSEPLAEKRTTKYLHYEGEAALPELLAHFGIARPILFGHSDGASIALLYASKFPTAPLALVLEAPHVFVEDVTIAGIIEAKEAFENGKLRRALKPYHTDSDSTFRGWNDIWLDPAFRDWNVEAELKTVHCPILVIQGREDQYGTLAQLDAIEKQIPKTELLVISDCRHSPHADQPTMVLERATEFVARVRHA